MATSTTLIELAQVYEDIGTAPMLIQVRPGSSVLIHVAPTLPDPEDPGLVLSAGGPPLAITGVGAVYARAVGTAAKVVVAVLA